jgi:23S rRNA pseudouridine955/2504/2580 synthase
MKIYEDEAILVLNKPYGLAVQGGSKTKRHIDGMLAALEKDGERPRLVHRLDRDTSGALVIAKTRLAAAALGKSFAGHDVEKTYWALVAGSPRPKQGTIRVPIAKRPVKSGKDAGQEKVVAADDADAQKATTDFMTVDAAGPVTFLAMKPLTGRTHQLRVHAAAMETPIVGDFKYGGPAARVEGVDEKLHLFCRSMRFPHPATGRMITVTAPLEGHMRNTWKFFSFDAEAKVVWPDIKSTFRKRK